MKYQGVRYRCAVIELIDITIANEIVNNLDKRYYSDIEIQHLILKKLLENQSLDQSLKYLASLQKHEVFNRTLKYLLDKYDFSSIYNKINSNDFKILSAYFYDEIATCKTCGKTFIKSKETSEYCSTKCSNSSDDVKHKKESTCLKHYGTKNHVQSEKYQNELRKRNQDKYGVNYYTYTDEFKNKSKQTKKERYRDEHYVNPSKQIQTRLKKSEDPSYYKNINSKRINTCLEKYGVQSVSMIEENKQKSKDTKIRLYGDPNYSNRNKAKDTCLKRYGVENPSETLFIKQKVKNTCLERYGNEFFTKSDYYKNCTLTRKMNRLTLNGKIKIDNLRNHLLTYVNDGIFDIQKMMSDFGYSYPVCCILKKKYNIVYPNVKNGVSKAQLDIYDFISCKDKILNHRKLIYPYELDIYIPSHKLAIEYDGLYWHSEKFHDSSYHIDKTLKCNDKGVQLFHIFEFEDIEIWKSMINNKLGLNKKIYARKCSLQEIDHTTAKVFCEQNHLQGYVNSSIRLGLYYDNELVQVMTFGKPRFNKDYDYELLRLCSLKGVNVVGGASKLFKYFTKHYSGTVISYANLRYSNGSVYEKLGFNKVGVSEPSYFYSNGTELLTRYQCQKHKLKRLKNYSIDKTEEQIMNENGYYKVYDCGNLIYKYS